MTDELTELDLMNDPMPEKKKPSGCECFDGTCDDDCLCDCECRVCEPEDYDDEDDEEEFYEMEFKERHQKPKSLFEFIPEGLNDTEHMAHMCSKVAQQVKRLNDYHERLADLKEEIRAKDKTDDEWCMPRNYYTKTYEARDARSFKTKINDHTKLLAEMMQGMQDYSDKNGVPILDGIPEVVDPLDVPYVIESVDSPEVFKAKGKLDKLSGDKVWEDRKSPSPKPDSNSITAWSALFILSVFGFFGFLLFMGLNW